MFSALRIKNFRLYWVGTLISFIGSWIQTIAQSWLVFQLTHSEFLLGLVGFLGSVPVFFLSLFGGVLADRFNKKTILLFTQNAFMILAFILAVLTQFELITPLQIIFISLLNGVVLAFDAPARQAVIVELTGKQYILNAIALNSAAFNSARVIGPALCALLIATIGMSGCFYVNGISFLAVIVALLMIKTNSAPKRNEKSFLMKDLTEGLIAINQNRKILVLIIMVGVIALFGISYLILMPVFADKVLKVGIKGLGLLMSSAGIGALFAALLLARSGEFRYKGRLLILSSIIFSLLLILFSLSKSYILSLISLIFMGGTSVMAMTIINTLLQTEVSDELRGRVMSVFMFTFAGLMPFGNLIAGVLSQALGVSLTIMINGIICTIFFIIINIFYPDIKNI